jgi:uncharacterized membrane protein HdeD (DUF308 family)
LAALFGYGGVQAIADPPVPASVLTLLFGVFLLSLGASAAHSGWLCRTTRRTGDEHGSEVERIP